MMQTDADLQKTDQEQPINLLTVGLAGILAGAAGVTVLALSDKDIRKQVNKRAKEIKNALQKWRVEKLTLLNNSEQKIVETTERLEDIPQKYEEKLHN